MTASQEPAIVPAYPTWTPCEDRDDPDSWDDVVDEPYEGEYHEPVIDDDNAD